MHPEIQRRLRNAFSRLEPVARQEAVGEGVAHCLMAYVRLHARGKAHVATPATLVYYSSRHVRRGRPAAGRLNGKEPLSRYAQLGKGIRLEHCDWMDEMVLDQRASVPDRVAAKLDVGAWFATLSRRMKHIARDLAIGFSTGEVALKYGVTASRISQLRRALEESWILFQGDAVGRS